MPRKFGIFLKNGYNDYNRYYEDYNEFFVMGEELPILKGILNGDVHYHNARRCLTL